MSRAKAYANYWKRKQLLSGKTLRFPVLRWWETSGLCDSEQVIYDAIRTSTSLLDIGAGDLRMMCKLQAAGYQGEYHTQDIGGEYLYTYTDLDRVDRKYGAILCLDVIEHLALEDGLRLLDRLILLLDRPGVLVLQTPNARCIRSPLAWDMSHLHCYNGPDLWAYLTCKDLTVGAYRVVFGPPRRTVLDYARFALQAVIVTRLLGCDYADNILLKAAQMEKR